MLINIWIYSIIFVILNLIYISLNNPGKMYLDTFITYFITLLVPGISLLCIIIGLYNIIFKSKEKRIKMKKDFWETTENLHFALQSLFNEY